MSHHITHHVHSRPNTRTIDGTIEGRRTRTVSHPHRAMSHRELPPPSRGVLAEITTRNEDTRLAKIMERSSDARVPGKASSGVTVDRKEIRRFPRILLHNFFMLTRLYDHWDALLRFGARINLAVILLRSISDFISAVTGFCGKLLFNLC